MVAALRDFFPFRRRPEKKLSGRPQARYSNCWFRSGLRLVRQPLFDLGSNKRIVEVCVDHRGLDVAVTEQLLQCQYRAAALNER